MRRFVLGPGAPEVSALACGVWRLADDPAGSDVSRVRAKIEASLAAGITTFDHADIYGGYQGEGLFGRALEEAPALRARMEIITKCGIKAPGPNLPGARVKHYDASAAAIIRAVDRSLQELRTDYLDVLLIHRPDWLTNAEDTAHGLRQVMASGKVRAVGVSNYSVPQYSLLEHFLGRPLATNQVELSLLHMHATTDGTLDQCQAQGAHPMAWSPLAGGRLLQGGEASQRLAPVLARIGNLYHASPEQIALAWVAALPSRPQVIMGTNRPERFTHLANAMAIQLEREHWYELWASAQGRDIP